MGVREYNDSKKKNTTKTEKRIQNQEQIAK